MVGVFPAEFVEALSDAELAALAAQHTGASSGTATEPGGVGVRQ